MESLRCHNMKIRTVSTFLCEKPRSGLVLEYFIYVTVIFLEFFETKLGLRGRNGTRFRIHLRFPSRRPNKETNRQPNKETNYRVGPTPLYPHPIISRNLWVPGVTT